jgi:hypothetical protein
MKWVNMNLRTRLHVASCMILLVGLGSAALIYVTAPNESNSAVGYEAADGYAYPIAPENSRIYTHDLELVGGKSAVLANELKLWFVGLWQGKSLAFTVAGISLAVFLAVVFVAQHSQFDTKSDLPVENNRTGTDR